MADNQTPPTADQLDARIANAEQASTNELKANNFIEAAIWTGKLEILKEWLASLRRTMGSVFAGLLLFASPALAAPPASWCALPAPTLTLPSSPRPQAITDMAMAALANLQPLDIYGNAGGTLPKTIGFGAYGHSVGVVYTAGMVDALNAMSGLRPNLRMLEANFSGADVIAWTSSAPGSAAVTARQRAINYGYGSPQVGIFWVTRANPDVNGHATRELVAAALANIKALQPALKVMYVGELGGAPYIPATVVNPLVKHSAIVQEAFVLHQMEADQIGVPAGMVMLHLPMATNGTTPNPMTASPSYPLGFPWTCSMFKVDGVHIASAEFGLAAGEVDAQVPVGTNIAERLAADPVMQIALFATPPPPPPPPVTVTISADLTLNGACTLTAVGPDGVTRTTMLTPDWCAGLPQ